jgi:tRNA dimethylallyltransferase
MPSRINLPKILVIVGPTAVGKTGMAIRLADALRGEIISADSRYFYQGMDIGTAKPLPGELKQIPHHLIDVTTPDKPWSLAVFQVEANRIIQEIISRGKLPILVGGTGQFVRAILEAWQVPELPPNPELRRILTNWGEQIGARELHRRLIMIDPIAATRMDPANLRRTVRAIEVILSTGHRFSDQSKQADPSYDAFLIGLRRLHSQLYARIDERIDQMIALGLVSEVKLLLASGFTEDLPAMSAIGYREMVDYLRGYSTLAEAVVLMRRNTRKYVRRQANWFKENDPSIHWFDMDPDPLINIIQCIEDWQRC